MSEYKDSGVDFLGKIPASWSTTRLKYCLSEPMKYGASESGVEYDENLCRYIRITDITADGELKDEGKLSLTDKQAAGYRLRDKTVLFARSGGTVGKSFMYKKEHGPAAFAGYLISAVADENVMLPEWLLYYTNSWAYQEWVGQIFTQATIQNIGADKYSNMPIVLAPVDEQRRILSFLDGKCETVNALISDIQKEIDLLETYKKSVITEAVTRGIDKQVELMDCDIEWLEKIPAHWHVKPFRYVLNERNEKNNPPQTDERLSLSIGLGVTTYDEKTTNLDRFKEDVSLYKLAHVGDLVMNSMNMIVGATGVSNYFGCVSPAYYTFYDNENDHIMAKYCEYLFLTPLLMGELHKLGKGIMFIERGEGKVNTCRLKVSRYDLGHLLLPVPPVDEVRKIVTYLDKVTHDIERVIEEKREQLSTLEVYRKDFVYEYITGKKSVIS